MNLAGRVVPEFTGLIEPIGGASSL